MIDQNIIKEYQYGETEPWVSNCVLAHKVSGSIRMTFDARYVN